MKKLNDTKRYVIKLTGIVQGVGFRPFIFRTANHYGLKGRVSNQGALVIIDVEGEKENLKLFIKKIIKNPPVQAIIEGIKIQVDKYCGFTDFYIQKSNFSNKKELRVISPDIAVCKKCMEDVMKKGSGRYRYEFTNCTDCGPRYTILKTFPYDRKNTTMSSFNMCRRCQQEYNHAVDRRFHTQTNCCSQCGPQLKLYNNAGEFIASEDCIKTVVEFLKQGKIIAIKGIGGYHLCCNAQNKEVVNLLRVRKKRLHKPLAVMARNIDAVEKLCHVKKKERDILLGSCRPIVLLVRKNKELLPQNIAPKQTRLGIMLPYTPLHLLLFDEELEYLVMTSGNISGAPIVYDNKEALQRLKEVTDYYLIHNREIITPVDDSVVKVIDEFEMVNRCGRGYAPAVFSLEVGQEILALGAEQKSSICLTQNNHAFLSQYIGDLKDYDTYTVFSGIINNFKKLYCSNPRVYVHDLNIDYLSSQYATSQEGIKIAVQHHHAHMSGCIAEYNLTQDVIGIIFDGTGLGTDGAVWGGEFFSGSKSRFRREGHLKYVTLQGGDRLIKEPWRSAACYLFSLNIDPEKFLHGIDSAKLRIVKKAVENRINCCRSSSMGRFFDCIASLTGIRNEITYDAQGAIELENQVNEDIAENYSYKILETSGEIEIDYKKIIIEVLRDIKNNIEVSIIATKFHNSIVKASADCVCKIRQRSGLNDVVLSGGVFENTYLLKLMCRYLRDLGFNVYYNMKVPINDGGISFGQAVIAGELLKEGEYVFGSSR